MARLLLFGLVIASARPMAAQHVVLTPAVAIPTKDAVSIAVRRKLANASGDSAVLRAFYLGRLVGMRLDTMLIERTNDTPTIAASDVVQLRVRHHSAGRERLENASEVATYGALLGTALGGIAVLAGDAARARAPRHANVIGFPPRPTPGLARGAPSPDP